MNRGKLNSRRKWIRIEKVALIVIVVFWFVGITIWARVGLSERKKDESNFLGKFGTMMVEMLAEDVPFTVFVPWEGAFKRDLGLCSNATHTDDNTYAMVSRVVGFSAIPRVLNSADVTVDHLSSYDSVSGFALFVSKDRHGMLLVNGVRSLRVDLRIKQVVVHLMEGVIMDSQFQDS